MMRQSPRARHMQAFGVGRDTPRPEWRGFGRDLAFGLILLRSDRLLWARRQTQSREHHCKSEARRLAEGALQDEEYGGAEKEKRQRISCAHLHDRIEPELQGERCSPNDEGEAEDRSTLEQDSGPFVLGEKEARLTGEEARAAARAHA